MQAGINRGGPGQNSLAVSQSHSFGPESQLALRTVELSGFPKALSDNPIDKNPHTNMTPVVISTILDLSSSSLSREAMYPIHSIPTVHACVSGESSCLGDLKLLQSRVVCFTSFHRNHGA